VEESKEEDYLGDVVESLGDIDSWKEVCNEGK
jgi:hypothetical protein